MRVGSGIGALLTQALQKRISRRWTTTKVVAALGPSLCEDVERVSGVKPTLLAQPPRSGATVVSISTLGHSPVIDRLAREGKFPAQRIAGKWESFCIATVTTPFPGIDRALVIAGSDKRGTIYGSYEISEQIGVSRLRVSMVDLTVVVTKLVLHETILPVSYFGPPEGSLNTAPLSTDDRRVESSTPLPPW